MACTGVVLCWREEEGGEQELGLATPDGSAQNRKRGKLALSRSGNAMHSMDSLGRQCMGLQKVFDRLLQSAQIQPSNGPQAQADHPLRARFPRCDHTVETTVSAFLLLLWVPQNAVTI